ncbi:hypothetical protein M9Y10_029570 [Tritrichomonas musculus]|uniref:Tetraspanin family protein n=1 Tax=Tritrichomonas musculus TaxID=1915356 RepID=A0ABR2KMH2_9EUKA
MRISDAFDGSRSLLMWIATGAMGASLFVELVVTAYWWSFYHPFAIHYNPIVMILYLATTFCWVFALVSLVLLILMVVSHFFIKPIADSSAISTLIVVFYTIFAIIVCLFGLISGVFGLLNLEFTIGDIKYKSKCLTMLFHLTNRPYNYAYDNNKAEDYGNMIYKILKKTLKNTDGFTKESFFYEFAPFFLGEKQAEEFETQMSNNALREYNSNLCSATGAPALVFAIILMVGLILFAIAACCCGAKASVGNESMDE